MQWGHIKTLFILSFLILNIYLISAFIGRQEDVSYLDNQELPIEDQIASEEITIDDSIQIDETQLAYISASQRELTDQDMEELDSYEDQKFEVFNNNTLITAQMENPVQLSPGMSGEDLEAAVLPNVLYGEEYEFWDWNEEKNVLIFFQTKEGRMIYYNENGALLVYLNEDNEWTHYSQTILGESEVQGDLVQLNQPIQVIGQLLNADYLNRGDNVNDLKIGYYSRIEADGIQVFAPTWKVSVNGERNHFVNAIEGIIYESDQQQFLQEVIGENAGRLNLLSEENELKKTMLPALEERLETDNRSESE